MRFQPDREVTKNAAALFVGRLLVMGSSFVLVLYAARVLGLTGFGRYALARMYFDLLLTLGVTGLSILITREIARTPSHAPVYLATAALMGQMLHMQVDIFSTRPLVQLLFVVAALISAMSRIDAPAPALDAIRRRS